MADISSSLPTLDKADGTDGAAAPTTALQVAGRDGSGNLQAVLTDTNGNLVVSERIALTYAAPTSASVGTSSATALAANANRKGLVLVNISSAKIFVAFGQTAVINSGIALYPGGIYVMDPFLYNTAAVSAIASAAASTLAIQEIA